MSEKITPMLDGVIGVLQRQTRTKLYAKRPDIWALDVLDVEFWSGQVEIGDSVVRNKNTMVAAGHGVGKSLMTAVLACWWLDTHAIGDATVLTTAPSTSQVRNVIWKNIQALHRKSRQRFEQYNYNKKRGLSLEGLPDHALPGRVTTQATWKSDEGEPIAFGRTPPRGREGDSFQGIHGNVFAIADEAVGVSEEMIQTLANNTSNRNDRRLLIANPTNPNSAMGRTWHDAKASQAWNKITISVLQSPMFTAEHESLRPSTIKDLVDQTYVEDKKLEYGEDSANYKARVLGLWALDSGMVMFPDEIVEIAKETTVIPDDDSPIRFGFDVARSEKGDFSYIYMAQEGFVYQTSEWIEDENGNADWRQLEEPLNTGRRGLKIRFIDSWRGIPFIPLHDVNGRKISEGANERVDNLCRQYGVSQLRVDGDGMGLNMIDALFDVCHEAYEIVEMHGNNPSPNRNAWYNSRAFNYSELANRMRRGEIDIDPEDSKLIDQLISIEYKIAKGFAESVLIESKTVLRAKGIKSPDAADAAVYAFADLTWLDSDAPDPGTRIEYDTDSVFEEDLGGFYSYSGF